MRTERIRGSLIARTGWITEVRRCPIHGTALELTFDESEFIETPSFPSMPDQTDANRVRWHCEACAGSYTENFFFRAPTLQPPSTARFVRSVSLPRSCPKALKASAHAVVIAEHGCASTSIARRPDTHTDCAMQSCTMLRELLHNCNPLSCLTAAK